MKGISLATESIIIIILAVLVLAALLIFFGSVWIPGSGQVVDTMKQAQWCGEYVKINPNCVGSVTGYDNILKHIRDACGDNICPSAIDDTTCAQKCCRTWCVGATTTSGSGGGSACTRVCVEVGSCPAGDEISGTCEDGYTCCRQSA